VRNYDATNSPQCYVDLTIGGVQFARTYLDSGGGWENVQATLRSGPATANLRLTFYCPSNRAATFGVDNLSFQQVTTPTAPESLPPAFRYTAPSFPSKEKISLLTYCLLVMGSHLYSQLLLLAAVKLLSTVDLILARSVLQLCHLLGILLERNI
jgi:hypothetical protein